jgi:signal transduction protein with GAF and PtsI domain
VNVSSSPVRIRRKDREPRRSALDLAAAVQQSCFRKAVDKTVLTGLLQLVRNAVRFDAATLYQIDAAGNWEELVSLGRPVEPLDFLPLGSGSGLSGWAAYSGRPVLLKDRTRSRHFNPDTDLASFLSVPIPQIEQPIGVLNLGGEKPNLFNEQHLEILEPVAIVLASILERAACGRSLDDTTHRLTIALDKLEQAEFRIAAGGAGALAGAMISHVHEINEQLSIIIGNIDCLMVEPLQGNQGTLTRLRRAEEAAVKLRACGRKLLRLTQPRNQTAKGTA